MPETPEELRARLAANLAVLNAAAAAMKADGAADAMKAAKEKEGKKSEAMEKAQGMAEKCMKAVAALHDHVSKSENDDYFTPEHKSAVSKAHKAVKAAHAAMGGESEESDEDGEKARKAELADAIKAATAPLEAQLRMLADRNLGPRGAGPGGVAIKGEGFRAASADVAKDPSKMTEGERKAEFIREYAAAKSVGMPLAEFEKTSPEALKALHELAVSDPEPAVV